MSFFRPEELQTLKGVAENWPRYNKSEIEPDIIISELISDLEAARAERDMCVEALEFYANYEGNTYEEEGVYGWWVWGGQAWEYDEGEKAQKALAAMRGEGGNDSK